MLLTGIIILLFYYIWKRFADLAFKYNHNKKWIYGVLGIVVYYGGTLIGGLILGFLTVIFDFTINWENNFLMSIIGVPFGLATCYATYYFLHKKWEREVIVIDSIDDIGKITQD
ncbi:hypothetical protein [Flavobacterium sp.]|uniref:hypothetical protein n=1 Tax=Flavobacterium sp. TaxID=239 RepID=UPI00375359A5